MEMIPRSLLLCFVSIGLTSSLGAEQQAGALHAERTLPKLVK